MVGSPRSFNYSILPGLLCYPGGLCRLRHVRPLQLLGVPVACPRSEAGGRGARAPRALQAQILRVSGIPPNPPIMEACNLILTREHPFLS